MSVTKAEVMGAVETIKIVADCIKAASEIPSGHLYAALNAKGMDVRTYDQIIGMLLDGNLITKKNHLLTWKG